jgi:hypothetical protein
MRRRLLAVPAIIAGTLSLASPAQAAIDRPVGVWQMNEAAGARTMVDSSGNRFNGIIGDDVLAGTALSGGGTGYRFPYVPPNQPPANPQRLAQVPHRAALNPGSGNFAVEFRMRTTHSFGSVVQKGQSGSLAAISSSSSPTGRSPACSGAPAAAAPRPPARSGSTTDGGTWSAASAPRPA